MAKKKKLLTRAESQDEELYFVPCLAADEGPSGDSPEAIAFALFEKEKRWPQQHELTISFWDSFPNAFLQEKVRSIATEWTEHINLTFKFMERNPHADVRISFTGKGHYSAIGIDSADRIQNPHHSMNLSLAPHFPESEFRRVILHEFGHALGLWHEHQNPDGGIPWNQEKVYAYFQQTQGWNRKMTFDNVLKKVERDSRRFAWSEFDPDSIMIYAIPGFLTDGSIELHDNTKLSPSDIKLMGQMYPKKTTEPPKPAKLVIDGAVAEDEIGKPGEIDVFHFDVKDGDGYVIETEGETDVTIGLYGPDDEKKLVVEDMDAGRDWNARIAEFLEPGKYQVKVWHQLPDGKGKYRISVKTWKPS